MNKLSPRENEVAMHIANGMAIKDIARKLGLKSNTVSTIKKNIFFKLGVESVIDIYIKMKT